MKINYIKIKGFRNINNLKLDFSGFDALVSLNNYGKRNVLKAIDFGINFIQAPIEAKKALMSSFSNYPLNKHIKNKNFYFEIDFQDQKDRRVNYKYEFSWQDKIIKAEELSFQITSEAKRLRKVIDRNDTEAFYMQSEKGRCDKPIIIQKQWLVINKLFLLQDWVYNEVAESINKLKTLYFPLTEINRYFVPGQVIHRTENAEIKIPMWSVAQYLFELKQNHKDKFEYFKDIILQLLPEISDFEPKEINFKVSKPKDLELPEKIYDLRVWNKYNNQDLSINEMSYGTRRILHILVVAMRESSLKRCNILMFEELENSIHPALLQNLLEVLHDFSENLQIIITSHSPYLIQYLNLNQIFIGLPNNKGFAEFKKIKKSKHKSILKFAQDMEMNLGEVIFDMLINGIESDEIF